MPLNEVVPGQSANTPILCCVTPCNEKPFIPIRPLTRSMAEAIVKREKDHRASHRKKG